MGCFVSCFRTRDREGNLGSRPRARSNSNSYLDLESLEEGLVVENQLGSLFLNDTEDNCDHPHILEEELRLEERLEEGLVVENQLGSLFLNDTEDNCDHPHILEEELRLEERLEEGLVVENQLGSLFLNDTEDNCDHPHILEEELRLEERLEEGLVVENQLGSLFLNDTEDNCDHPHILEEELRLEERLEEGLVVENQLGSLFLNDTEDNCDHPHILEEELRLEERLEEGLVVENQLGSLFLNDTEDNCDHPHILEEELRLEERLEEGLVVGNQLGSLFLNDTEDNCDHPHILEEELRLEERLEEGLVVENQLGSLFLNGETDMEDNCDHPHTLEEELRLEAKHLKLCGAILETPLEIRKSKNRIALRELNGTNQSPNSAHIFSNKKIHLFAHCERSSPGQAIIGASGPGKEILVSRQNTPGTGSAGEMRANKLNLTPVGCDMGTRAQDPNSPYPTPIHLNDDMQTPATIYSSHTDNSIIGKRQARIRLQYAYPALERAQRAEVSTSSELEKKNELAGEFSFTNKSSGETPKILVSGETPKSSEETPKVLVPTLSGWLKPTTVLRGIPNTTTKYKEDQQVTWHTTPFEERLERVLTDDKLPPSRKLTSGRLIELQG